MNLLPTDGPQIDNARDGLQVAVLICFGLTTATTEERDLLSNLPPPHFFRRRELTGLFIHLEGNAMFMSKQIATEYLLAGNPQLSTKVLDDLSQSDSSVVRERIAENIATPLYTLLRLMSDPDSSVRLSLAHNPALPRMFLTLLVQDEDPDVRLGLAENMRLPESILSTLANDENPYVAHRASLSLARLANDSEVRAVA